jgi:serine protease Do
MNLRLNSFQITTLSLFAFCLIGGMILFNRQIHLEHLLADAALNVLPTVVDAENVSAPQIVEKIVSNAQLWRPVQDKVKDTVVQIFAHVAVTDMLQPYKTSQQGTSSGSGFFINERGEFITNAHVVGQAKGIWIQIPSLGKHIIDAELIGISPERDIALLRVTDEGLAIIRKELGAVPYLPLGDSDYLHRSDEVLALGYPLGQQALKSTTGVISGQEHHMIQMSAPINPGSSGGPLLNSEGEVVGINSAGVMEAQNVGYAIPINDLKIVLNDLYKVKILRKPYLGVLFNNANESLVESLGNPMPGGCYVVDVVKESTLDKAGVKRGDMIYEMNGYIVDMYGEMRVPWSEDKISILDFVSRLSIGQEIKFVVYRNGDRKDFEVKFDHGEKLRVGKVYPELEGVDYEVFGGIVVMQLSMNHLHMLMSQAPGLAKYASVQQQEDPVLVITHIFPNSQAYRSRALGIGATINKVNGQEVHTLEEYRAALKKHDDKFFTLVVSDNITNISDEIPIVLPWKKIMAEEPKLAHDYKYPITEVAKELLALERAQDQLKGVVV